VASRDVSVDEPWILFGERMVVRIEALEYSQDEGGEIWYIRKTIWGRRKKGHLEKGALKLKGEGECQPPGLGRGGRQLLYIKETLGVCKVELRSIETARTQICVVEIDRMCETKLFENMNKANVCPGLVLREKATALAII
jgi:hypothetical protein